MSAAPSINQANVHGRLDSIQFLRGVASLLVVFHHALRALTANRQQDISFDPVTWFDSDIWIPFGAVGVDIFFVISGVVMVYVSAPYVAGVKPVSDFLTRRVIRIYPIYLFMTAVVVALAIPTFLGKPSQGLPDALQWDRILTSLLFIPSFNSHGVPHPVLGVGWTLIFEMMFYGCFALALFLNRQYLVTICSVLVLGVLLVAWAAKSLWGSDGAITEFFSSPISIEFIMGCMIARLALSGKTLPLYPALFVLVASIVAIGAVAGLGLHKEHLRALVWGIPSALLVYSFISIEWSSVNFRWPRALTYLGDISYSLYLVHVVIIYTFYLKGLKMLGITSSEVIATEWILLGAVAVSLVGGVALYHLVEKPCLNLLRRMLDSRRPVKAQPAAA